MQKVARCRRQEREEEDDEKSRKSTTCSLHVELMSNIFMFPFLLPPFARWISESGLIPSFFPSLTFMLKRGPFSSSFRADFGRVIIISFSQGSLQSLMVCVGCGWGIYRVSMNSAPSWLIFALQETMKFYWVLIDRAEDNDTLLGFAFPIKLVFVGAQSIEVLGIEFMCGIPPVFFPLDCVFLFRLEERTRTRKCT